MTDPESATPGGVPPPDADSRGRLLAAGLLASLVLYHLVLLLEQVRHPEPFFNDSVLHFGLIRALASAPGRGQSLLDPWVPTFTLGFPVFHYYQSLPHLLVVALWKISLESLSLVRAFRIVEWLAVGTLPLPVYWAGRKMGFGRAAALGAATLALGTRTAHLHGLDLESYVWRGLGQFAQAVGGWFLPLGLAWTYAALRDGKGLGKATTLMTVTFLSHLALGYMGFMAAGVLALLSPREIPRRLLRLALVAGATVAASAWTVLPILRDFAYYNVSTLVPSWKYLSFGHATVLRWLVRGELFDFGRPPVMTALVGIGIAWATWRTIRAARSGGAREGASSAPEAERFLLAVFVFFLLLFFGRPTWGRLLDLLPLGSGFHYSRALYVVHLAGTMLAGIAAGELLDRLRKAHRLGPAGAVLVALAVASPLGIDRTAYLLKNADLVRESAISYEAERDDLERALALCREDRNGRVYAGQGAAGGSRGWGGQFQVGWVPVYAWFPVREMDALGYLYHMWSLNADFHDAFDERNPAHYRVFNVRRILAPPDVRTAPFAREIRRFGRFRVLEVDGPGFVELVDSPYAVSVPKRNVSRVHRRWLNSPLPRRGVYPVLRLPEAGDPVGDAVVLEGVDIRFPEVGIPEGPRGKVQHVERRGEDFSVRVRVERPCHLVLKMTYHPGWRVRVDGSPAEKVHLLPSFVGVRLEPGEHDVELRYDPGPGRGILALAGLLLVILLLIGDRRLRL